jgi:hypothetical protein
LLSKRWLLFGCTKAASKREGKWPEREHLLECDGRFYARLVVPKPLRAIIGD